MIHSWAIGRIQGEFRFCGQGESTVDSIWEIYDFVRASGWVAIVSWRNVFCKHSVWISTTHFGVNPKPPRLRKCYDFLNFGHFPLTGWEAVCYSELAEILCTAPLQLNTQHNRYFTLPMGRAARSRQTITHDWGEGIMILLLPHASDGVTAFGLESVRSLQGQ